MATGRKQATKSSVKSTSAKGAGDMADVQVILEAAIKAGVINPNATIPDVAQAVKNSDVGTLGYAVAWDRYVAVVK